MLTNKEIAILDCHLIPHDGTNIDLDAWAARFGCTVEDGKLVSVNGGKKQFAAALSTGRGLGCGWSTFNEDVVDATGAATNLMVLTLHDLFGKNWFWDRDIERGGREIMSVLAPDAEKVCVDGLPDTHITWMDMDDSDFYIVEYDGRETIHTIELAA